MASQTPIPPMRPRRSFAGPFVLIVLGFLLLLANMGKLPWETLGQLFAHYWPILLILWGVIKLVEYQQAQKQGLRPAGIGVGGVFLLVVLIVCGLAATQAARVNWGSVRDNINIDGEDFPLFGTTYNYDDQLQEDFPAGGSLRVVSDRGAVTINTSDDNQVHVMVHKRVSAGNQGDADKWNTQTKPTFSTSDHTVTLNANTQAAGDHWVSTDLTISLPRKAAVTVSGRRGDVSVLGRDGDVTLSSQRGDVSADDINGKATLTLEHSSARISKISGDVSVEGRPNDVSLDEVAGTVRLNGEFDSIKLSKIAGPVTFKSQRSDMEFGKLNGDLDMDSGDLRANDLAGPFRMTTRSKDIHLDGVSGDVRIEDTNGDISLRMTKLGSIQVENRKGDLQIYVPDKSSFQLDARSRGGEFQTDFSELKVNNGDDQSSATGSVGSGGPHIVLNNEHGTIEIRKGSSVAEITEPPAPPKPMRAPVAPKVKPMEPTEN
jgi:DUF4097 and DUF4098 domain-containing protein YvlB